MKNFDFIKKESLITIENTVTFSVILLCMILFSFFPTKGVFQQIILSTMFLLAVPFLYIKIVLKSDLRDFGFKITKWKEGFFVIPACALIVMLTFYLVIKYTNFSQEYFLSGRVVVTKFWYLFFYEFVAVNLFVFLYEVFFRGFVMFYFINKVGVYSIFIQFIFFLLFLDLLERINLNSLFYIIVAPLAGLIAYKSKSLVYSYLFSIIVMIAGDIIYLKMIK